MNSKEETHPFKWYIPGKSKSLIIGTFPPIPERWSYNFFYPNKQNLFWPLMAKVASTELKHFSGNEAVQERKQILDSLKVAITDMGHKITRKNNNSLDENLLAVAYMDIFKILKENPSITKLIFTSSSGPVSAAKWFVDYLKSKNILHKFPKGIKPIKSDFIFNQRKIELVILYSPSRRAANRFSIEYLAEMYKTEILSN